MKQPRRFIPHRIWIAYYVALWTVRCYVWHPISRRLVPWGDWLFDQADLQVRYRS